jgi:C-terminal processing protease CtpA/Prc
MAAIEEARAVLPAQADGETFGRILERLVAKMGDGHGRAYLPCAAPPARRWPFTVVDTLDGVVIDDPDPMVTRLSIGDRLVAVNGTPIEKLIAELEERTSAATAATRRKRALEALPLTFAAQIEVSTIDAAGHLSRLRLATVPVSPESEAPVEWRSLGDGVGYLRIRTLMPPGFNIWIDSPEKREKLVAQYLAQVDKAFDALASSRALVFDLRGDLGGFVDLAARVADHLVAPGRVFYSYYEKIARGAWSQYEQYKPPRVAVMPYAERVVVLIDESTASSAEVLAAFLRSVRPKTLLVGRPSAGAGGHPHTTMLVHSRARVVFSDARVFDADGRSIEGNSVVPDVLQARRRLDVVRHVDVDLASALDLLSWHPGRD